MMLLFLIFNYKHRRKKEDKVCKYKKTKIAFSNIIIQIRTNINLMKSRKEKIIGIMISNKNNKIILLWKKWICLIWLPYNCLRSRK